MKVICALRDSGARYFGQPMFVHHVSQAIRSLRDEVNKPAKDSDVSRHPGDFELYRLGEYDEGNGEIVACDPELLARAKDLVDPED